jgi:integrase
LIEEGFLRYVEKLPAGSPLFPDLSKGFYGGRGETATKRHGRWVRALGITDPSKAPAHSWRHRMKDALRFLRVPPEAADALLGHDNPTNAGAGYGAGWRGRPDELAKELAKVSSPIVPAAVREKLRAGRMP